MLRPLLDKRSALNSSIWREKTQAIILVFITGFIIFFFELLISRLMTFYIGAGSTYFAIPFALFGITIGSLLFQLILKRIYIPLAGYFLVFAILITASIILFLKVGNKVFAPFGGNYAPGEFIWATTLNAVIFSIPFVAGGSILDRKSTRLNSSHT